MFVVFEGIDGSGKTTVSSRVAKQLRAAGLSVEHQREGGIGVQVIQQMITHRARAPQERPVDVVAIAQGTPRPSVVEARHVDVAL